MVQYGIVQVSLGGIPCLGIVQYGILYYKHFHPYRVGVCKGIYRDRYYLPLYMVYQAIYSFIGYILIIVQLHIVLLATYSPLPQSPAEGRDNDSNISRSVFNEQGGAKLTTHLYSVRVVQRPYMDLDGLVFYLF